MEASGWYAQNLAVASHPDKSIFCSELRLEVYPIVAGTGERLFHEGKPAKPMQLADSKITGNGVAILKYRPGNRARSDTAS
jgi:hypothetical protein